MNAWICAKCGQPPINCRCPKWLARLRFWH